MKIKGKTKHFSTYLSYLQRMILYIEINNLKQECIPVGCVPSAAVAISPTIHTPCYAHPLLCTPPATHAPPPVWTE